MSNDWFKNIDFPVTNEYSKKDIHRVQKELLEMIKIIKNILEKNNIPYFIAFGSLIGAVKFQGFLPWDDDIDLFLFDDTYDKAIDCLEYELPSYLIVHGEKNDENYFLAWNSVKNILTRVQDNDIYHSDNKRLNFRCLGVDLYRLKKLKPSQIPFYKYEEALKFFNRKKELGFLDDESYKYQIERISIEFNNNSSLNSNSNEDDIYYFILKLKKIINNQDIFPLKKYKFENIELFGPNNFDAVLTSMFGDYSNLPKYEDRLTHLKSVKFLDKTI